MTGNHAIHSLLAHYPVLLAFAVTLLVGCCVLAILLVRAVRARRARAHVVPDARIHRNDFPDAEDVLAVIEDAQRILSSSENILSSTARDLESSRQRLERLRVESAVRRRAMAATPSTVQEGET
jgi:hypothetical protein